MSETDTLATTDTNAGDGSQGAPTETVTDQVLGGEATGTKTEAVVTEADTTKTEEVKTEGEKKPDDKTKTDVPETYEFKAPEGQALDETLVSEFTPLAKDLQLSQEQAQKVVDLYATKVLPRIQAAMAEQWAKTQVDWAQAAKADKEFGGDAFDANVALANQAVARFGGPELVKALKDTGAGNHPEVIRAFYRVGKAISEDKVVIGATGGGQRDTADVLYPTMAKQG